MQTIRITARPEPSRIEQAASFSIELLGALAWIVGLPAFAAFLIIISK